MILNPLEIADVFPDSSNLDPVSAIEFRLRQLSRTETLRYCAHLNLFVANSGEPLNQLQQQPILAQMFLNRGAMQRIQRRVNELRRGRYGHISHQALFHRGQLLELIRWVVKYCPDSARYSDPTQNNRSRKIFAEAALFATELMLNRIYGDVQLGNVADVVRKSSLGPVRQSALDTSSALDPLRAFGRGYQIMRVYLPQECPEFEQAFQEFSGLSLDEYYTCLFVIWAHYQDVDLREAQQRHVINLPSLCEQLPHLADTLRWYIALESQTPDELQESLWRQDDVNQLNLLPIRQKPILALSDEQFIVLDPVFHTEKITVGPLFLLSRQIRNLLSDFGNAFENYAKNILQQMYATSSSRLIVDLHIQSRSGQQEITDTCLIEDDQLVLFEMKGKWIRDDRATTPNYEEYVDELTDKYGEAATQLARAINNLITREWAIDGYDITETRRIYPVLLAYDASLNVLGNAWFFAERFKDEIGSLESASGSHLIMLRDQWEIAPLIVLTVDMLENLEASISNFNLTDLFRDYIAFREETFQGAKESLSLLEYINVSNYAQRMDFRGTVVNHSLEAIEAYIREIVPLDMQDGLFDDE